MTLAELAKRLEEIHGPIVECPEGHEFYKNNGECDVCAAAKFVEDLPFAGGSAPVIFIRKPKPQ